jgi:hypothetical protein
VIAWALALLAIVAVVAVLRRGRRLVPRRDDGVISREWLTQHRDQ